MKSAKAWFRSPARDTRVWIHESRLYWTVGGHHHMKFRKLAGARAYRRELTSFGYTVGALELWRTNTNSLVDTLVHTT